MKKYDSFLSYATEDMQAVAELAGALKARDFKIWYDKTSLNVGDSLLRLPTQKHSLMPWAILDTRLSEAMLCLLP